MKPGAPIRRLAIVNRGEAAMRCIRAVKALRAEEGSDLQAIALYTAADRDVPFVRHADAVWPGWGFVAEDPVFVERLAAAGIRFLGPDPRAMRRLGDKISSKEL